MAAPCWRLGFKGLDGVRPKHLRGNLARHSSARSTRPPSEAMQETESSNFLMVM
jgi:hypothetical protein